MATYSNQHWLLSHIRNSFISTDDTGMCETVMVNDDMAKHYLRKFETDTPSFYVAQSRKSVSDGNARTQRVVQDPPLQEVDFICYPDLAVSDDEDKDQSAKSFEIKMESETRPHRMRSNTAQKLEKMDIAKRKAARTKCINYDDDIVEPERSDFFLRKEIPINEEETSEIEEQEIEHKKSEQNDEKKSSLKSKLSIQLANSPKQSQNKFMEYARFDGTSQSGIQTKRINVFLSMLPEPDRNYPIKICVLGSAKIIEVIGFICYRATIQFPTVPLKSIRNYALYMTEDIDDMEEFPPLDNREPCSKFGFSHLTLAERRPLAPVTRVDFEAALGSKSMTSEEDKARLAAVAVRSLQSIDLNGGQDEESGAVGGGYTSEADNDEHINDYEDHMLSHNDMLEAPLYRTFRVQIVDKRFFRTEVTLGISGERIEIDQHKNTKFWTKQKTATYPIENIAYCQIIERRHLKAILRIWLRSASSSLSSSSTGSSGGTDSKVSASNIGGSNMSNASPHSPNSPSGQHTGISSPFAFLAGHSSAHNHPHIRFKHYDFEADVPTADQINNKLNCILKVRSSEVRREFLQLRERKLEKSHAKKHLKM